MIDGERAPSFLRRREADVNPLSLVLHVCVMYDDVRSIRRAIFAQR